MDFCRPPDIAKVLDGSLRPKVIGLNVRLCYLVASNVEEGRDCGHEVLYFFGFRDINELTHPNERYHSTYLISCWTGDDTCSKEIKGSDAEYSCWSSPGVCYYVGGVMLVSTRLSLFNINDPNFDASLRRNKISTAHYRERQK